MKKKTISKKIIAYTQRNHTHWLQIDLVNHRLLCICNSNCFLKCYPLHNLAAFCKLHPGISIIWMCLGHLQCQICNNRFIKLHEITWNIKEQEFTNNYSGYNPNWQMTVYNEIISIYLFSKWTKIPNKHIKSIRKLFVSAALHSTLTEY